MRNVQGYPPNFSEIKEILNPPEHAIYCWGEIIYNPQGHDLRQDIVLHESVHTKQQQECGTPELWWARYLHERDFRYEQEVEAYGAQYRFLLDLNPPNMIAKLMLQELATELKSRYDLDIEYGEAESKIRNYAKYHAEAVYRP